MARPARDSRAVDSAKPGNFAAAAARLLSRTGWSPVYLIVAMRIAFLVLICACAAGCYDSSAKTRVNPAPDGVMRGADAGQQRGGGQPPQTGSGAGGNPASADGTGGVTNVQLDAGDHQHDAGQHGGSGGIASDSGAHVDASIPPFTDAAVAVLGAPCANLYEWACTGHRSSESIRCAGSPLVWMLGDVCESGSFCDTRVGAATQGHCQPIATACVDKAPGDSVCADIDVDNVAVSMRKRCGLDLVAYEDDDCPADAHCVDLGGTRMSCACDSGFDDGDEDAGALQCIDIDECSVDHGGCDALVSCINTPGSHDCGPCPESHAGTGKTSCVPVTTSFFGSDGNDLVYAISTDTNGNVFVGGTTTSALDGNTNSGGNDVFIVKLSGAGQKQWTRQLSVGGNSVIRGIATDANGNVYAVGGGTSRGGGPNGTTSSGGFILKYDGAGQQQWTREIQSSGSGSAYAYGVATDASGGVYVAAAIAATTGTVPDFTVLKYDGAGELQWTRSAGANLKGVANGVATDANGNVYAAGLANDTSNPGSNVPGTLLVKYDASGTQQWQQFVSGKAPTWLGIGTDASGDVYVVGNTGVGSAMYRQYATFLVKYDAAGEQQWLQQWANSQTFPGLAVDASGNAYVASMTTVTVDQNGDPSPGGGDALLLKYDGAGVRQWARVFGSSGGDTATCAAIDKSGTLFVAGISSGNFDGFANAGGDDVFLARFDATGTQL